VQIAERLKVNNTSTLGGRFGCDVLNIVERLPRSSCTASQSFGPGFGIGSKLAASGAKGALKENRQSAQYRRFRLYRLSSAMTAEGRIRRGLPILLQRAFARMPPASIRSRNRDQTTARCARGAGADVRRVSKRRNRTGPPKVDVLLPHALGDFAPERSPSIEKLRDFATAFLAMEVKALTPISISAGSSQRGQSSHRLAANPNE